MGRGVVKEGLHGAEINGGPQISTFTNSGQFIISRDPMACLKDILSLYKSNRMYVCLFVYLYTVTKNLTNCLTDMVLLYSEALL